MAEQWPASLQQKLNQADFSETLSNTGIRSETDIGLPKVRRRYTKGFEILACSVNIERTDVITFRNFYDTTLNGGTLTFEFTDPFTDSLQEFRFIIDNPPQINIVGGNEFRLRMSWERVP